MRVALFITFQEAAKVALANPQLRRTMGKATQTIRAKRAAVVDELPDWEALREAGRAIKARTLRHLDDYLLELEASVQRAGGQVHWARDAQEANRIGRQTLNCICCSACLNICPVYERTGGHAYGSVYPGPIGAILTPQLVGVEKAGSLPYASTLCGACYEVCPIKINIPEVLLHMRGEVVRHKQAGGLRGRLDPENVGMQLLARVFERPERYEQAQRLARLGQWPLVHGGVIGFAPGPLAGWTAMRDLFPVADQTFREWWRHRGQGSGVRDQETLDHLTPDPRPPTPEGEL